MSWGLRLCCRTCKWIAVVLSVGSRCVLLVLSVDGSTHLLVLLADSGEEGVCDPVLCYLM